MTIIKCEKCGKKYAYEIWALYIPEEKNVKQLMVGTVEK